MELDIWIPKYQLALEYQGEHHYHDFHNAYGPNGTLALYAERDLKKRNGCLERGITLVTIPYWWDGKKESLSSTLHQLLPDVFPRTDHPGIPPHPPKKESSLYQNHQVSTFLTHGRNWNTEQDPTGWFISEKLDGFRAFWDGQKLYTKSGNPFSVPVEFTQSFPRDVCLDGELWIDYANFNNLSSIKRKSDELENQELETWQNVKFCVFDAPMHPGYYLERHQFATNSVVGCDSNICVIPIEQCMGLDHLFTVLNQVIEKKGEGVMLYHPTSKYTPGRTTNLLKVKAFQEEDVKFIKCNLHSYSFVCEQKNGIKCIVKCSGWDYMFPPSPGSVLTVKHNGFFTKSQKMKYPHLLRVRSELEWDQIKTEL